MCLCHVNITMTNFSRCQSKRNNYLSSSRAFDALNSSSPVGRDFKAPLRPSTFPCKKEVMEAAGRDLMDLKLATRTPVVHDGKRMSVISLAFTLKSVSRLAEMIFDAELCR